MKTAKRRMIAVAATAAIAAATAAIAAVVPAPAGASGVAYATGDLFAAIGNAQVKHFDSTGTLKDTLTDVSSTSYTAGMAFDSSDNLYVTDFDAQTVSKFDNQGNYVGVFASGFAGEPESIVFDNAGDAYVGQADASTVEKFDASGNPLASFTVQTESRGTDWIDLAADQCTLLYTSEGTSIQSYNVCTNTQNPPFTTGMTGAAAYALRIRPNGEVLVADSGQVLRFDSSGTLLQAYTFPNSPADTTLFALNLDPDGTSFWTGDLATGDVFRVGIATGNVITSFNANFNTALGGLAVFHEIVVSVTTTTSTTTTSTSTSTTTTVPVTLTTSIVGAPEPVTAGFDVQYTVTVKNDGTTPVSGVQVTDSLPAGTTFASASSGCVGTGPVTCSLGTINGSSSKSVSIVVHTAPGSGGTTITDSATTTPGGSTATFNTHVTSSTGSSASGFVPPGGSITAGGDNPATLSLPPSGPGAVVMLNQVLGANFCKGPCVGPATFVNAISGYNDPRQPIDLKLTFSHRSQGEAQSDLSTGTVYHRADDGSVSVVPDCKDDPNWTPAQKKAAATRRAKRFGTQSGIANPPPCVDRRFVTKRAGGVWQTTFEMLYLSPGSGWARR